MDKRKLTVTIVGVILFTLLIAGATFAFLLFTTNITNGNYNTKTKDFNIIYKGGTAVSEMLQTDNPTTSNLSKGSLLVTASKTAETAKASSFKINLDITNNTITTKSIAYAVCKNSCPTDVKLATISGSGTSTTATCASGVVACGTISGTTDITLYDDTETFNTNSAVPTTTYKIYFWVNLATLVETDFDKEFSAKITASATQGD